MSIEAITKGIKGIQGLQEFQAPEKQQEVSGGKSFGDTFANALKEVDGLQKDADSEIEGVVMNKDGVTPHGAMLALEKADVAFQLMNTIRAKIVRAYEDVLRTQV